MHVSVVLCTHNRASLLATALGSLEAMRHPLGLSWELLVVDNNSTDDTKAVVEAAIARGVLPCQYVFESRQGKSHALNTGIASAAGEVLAFSDDDVTFDEDWLGAVWRAFEHQRCVGIGGRIVPVWRSPRPRWFAETGPHSLMTAIVSYDFGDMPGPVRQPPYGANMAYRREAFDRCGTFDPQLGPSGRTLMRGEDTEFGRRLIRAGELIVYWPAAIVYHPVEPQRLRKRYFQSFYYHYGRMEARTASLRAEAVRWFGVPRYLVRELFDHAIRWATTWAPQARFHHRVECARILGDIVESFRRYHVPRVYEA